MHEHGEVALRERRLVLRDRVERDLRIGDDLLAIGARDLQMLIDTLGLETLRRQAPTPSRRVATPILHATEWGGPDRTGVRRSPGLKREESRPPKK